MIGGTEQQRLLQNFTSGQEAVMYRICLAEHANFQEEAMKYEYRRKQQQHLVEVYYAGQAATYFGCSGKIWLNVLVERISYRLSDIVGLSSTEGLYVLKNALVGFKTIQQINGVIQVDDTLIGFNQEWKVKVWLNSNLAVNSPELGKLYQKATTPNEARSNQITMVDRVVRMVWMHVREIDQPSFLTAYKITCIERSCGGLSFF